MQSTSENVLVTKLEIQPKSKQQFIDWQAKLHAKLSAFPGFASLEISSPNDKEEMTWVIVQRFRDADSAANWQNSKEFHDLMDEMKKYLIEGTPDQFQSEVTQVFVTKVAPHKDEIYLNWMAKMHRIEATFPGFRGVCVQSPTEGKTRNWITFLKFDNQTNLDRWLSSPERKKILKESKTLIDSLDCHRMSSPYAGWFSSASLNGKAPSAWKQTMLVLLVLFPIVMLEFKYLNPLTGGLNLSLATFLGNMLSVSLIAWPMMPIAIWFLGWWLTPNRTLLGFFIVVALYIAEIYLFWS